MLKSRGGAGTVNPQTGLPEFYASGVGRDVYSYLDSRYGLPDQATLDAQKAAEKAAAKKAAGPAPPPALTAEQRQANIARDLALSQTRGARPSGQDSQFYQPAYQPQYNNYTTTNPFSVSQYGTPMTARSLVDSAYAGVGRYGSGNQMNQVDPGGRQYWENSLNSGALNPQDFFNTFSSVINQARQDQSNPYSQFLQNQTGYSGADFGRGYAQQPMQQRQAPFNPYTNQYQTPFSYQQPQGEIGDMEFKPERYQQRQQMQTPFSYQQPAAQPNYGPSQAIVGRSSQMGGAPNVMRRAEGGITSLLDNYE